MIFLQKEGRWINMKGMPFKKYLKYGYNNYRATIDDWFLHMSSFFPDTRLKNFIEIRNCDCQKAELICSPAALWKGLMYNDDAIQAVIDIINRYNWEILCKLRQEVPKHGLNTVVKNVRVIDIAKEIVTIAYSSLNNMNISDNNGKNESVFLEYICELLNCGKSPADVLLSNWNGIWNKNINKLIEYSRLV